MRLFLFGLVGLLLVGIAFSLDKQWDCKCQIKASRRIIGGRDAAQNAIPWQISLSEIQWNPVPDNRRRLVPDKVKTQAHFCGGSIVNENWLITAAHCVRSQFYNSKITTEIGFGSNDLAHIYVKNQYKQIEAIYIHPEHQPMWNDVALLKLATPLQFREGVQPACLDFEERSIYDGAMKISGWGFTSGGSHERITPRFLKETDVFDYSREATCRREQNICMRNERDFSTSCLKDSGGPVHYTKNGKSSVVGVASFVSVAPNRTGRDRCTGDMGYTRLSRFKSWVESKIGQNYCS